MLRSPIVGCTSQELAELRIQYPDGLLYESVSAYAGENEIPEKELDPDKLKSELLNSNLRTDEKNSLNIKLKGFLSLLEKVRNMAAYTPVHEIDPLCAERNRVWRLCKGTSGRGAAFCKSYHACGESYGL